MATDMAIMGFGGGVMSGSPRADLLMKHYATPTSVGVWQTFLTLAAVYFVFMICGALGYRVPREGWQPAGWTPPPETARKGLITRHNVHLNVAWRTKQFWLLWAVLCLNVTAGIGILGMASPLLQEVFAGHLIGVQKSFTDLSPAELAQIATIAAGFTGLLSLFNIAGRFFWASLSDRLGRKVTYAVFFLLGLALYSSIPWTSAPQALAMFVGAIHGRILTAWAAAGIFGPVLGNYIREYQLAHGIERASAYNITMYILAALLAVGFVCNWLVRPVSEKHHMKEDPAEAKVAAAAVARATAADTADVNPVIVVLAWAAVWIPIGWGVYMP